MGIEVRVERPGDHAAIRQVHRLAFGHEDEARLVDALREGGYARTLGKLVNISDDIGEFDRSAGGTLRWFVGGKPVTFERKGKGPFSATPTARLMLACNQLFDLCQRALAEDWRMHLYPCSGECRDLDTGELVEYGGGPVRSPEAANRGSCCAVATRAPSC